MYDLIFWIGVFVVSLAILVKASDYFTDSAEKIGLFFGLPPFIVGVTIVSIGTSLPELVSSIIAVLHGSSEIVIGNVVGSNIANILLVLGVAAIMIKKIQITYEIATVDLPLLMGSTFFLAATIWDGDFSFFEGVLCLVILVIYLIYTIKVEKSGKDKVIDKELKDLKREKWSWKNFIILIASTIFIYLGAKYTVESVVRLSQPDMLNIGAEIIAISAVALGTSLPELMVTISAARKGKAEIAVGNVLGSNIFNALGVMGIPALFGVLIIPSSILTFGLPIMIVSTLLFYFITIEKTVTRWEGLMLLVFYLFFVGKLFGLF